jgi:hypothetical protein
MTDPEIIIESLGGLCPVQANGTIDGEPFYFRSRHEHWQLEIGPGNTHLVVEAMGQDLRDDEKADAVRRLPVWRHCERYSDEEYAAGYISDAEARAFIAKGADLWRASLAEVPSDA